MVCRNVLLLCLTFLVGSCGNQSQTNTEALATKSEVAELSGKVMALEARLSGVESTQKLGSEMAGLDEIAYITPGTNGYSLIKADLGIFTVSMVDVKPYANGSKVALMFGNIYSA